MQLSNNYRVALMVSLFLICFMFLNALVAYAQEIDPFPPPSSVSEVAHAEEPPLESSAAASESISASADIPLESDFLDSGPVPEIDLSQVETYQRQTIDELATLNVQIKFICLVSAVILLAMVLAFLWWLFAKVFFGGV